MTQYDTILSNIAQYFQNVLECSMLSYITQYYAISHNIAQYYAIIFKNVVILNTAKRSEVVIHLIGSMTMGTMVF